jgi:hypothetical protein
MLAIDYWIDRLEDPFERFPMQSVARALAEAAKEQEERRFGRASPWGISSAYYSVEDEHDIEVVEHLVGAAFVLGQAAITQAISILKRMHEEAGKPSWIPSDKAKIMEVAAPVHSDTGLSKITIINAVADFYKHRYEWKDEEWSGPDIKNKTIRIGSAIGLGPKGYHNLEHALRELKIYLPNMAPLAQLVVTWRENLADYIRAEGKKNGVSIAPRFPEDNDPLRDS